MIMIVLLATNVDENAGTDTKTSNIFSFTNLLRPNTKDINLNFLLCRDWARGGGRHAEGIPYAAQPLHFLQDCHGNSAHNSFRI